MLLPPARLVVEAYLLALAHYRPEVLRLHLARAVPSGLDRRLVHALDARAQDRLPLRVVAWLDERS